MSEDREQYPWVEELSPWEEGFGFRRDLEPYQDELPRSLARAAVGCAALGLACPPIAFLGLLLGHFVEVSASVALGWMRRGELDRRGRRSASRIKVIARWAMVANAVSLYAFFLGCIALFVILSWLGIP